MSTNQYYKALVVRESGEGQFTRSIENLRLSDLPQNEVLVRVHYAALNYKDALSASGHKGITRKYPHTPGVDASGVVVESAVSTIHPGDEVIVTSYDLGMNTPGGFAAYIRVPAEWVIPKPATLSLRQAMILGTGGITAALAIQKMEQAGQHPGMGEIVVTGATGGVGSMAVALLAKCGYQVGASTGKQEAFDYLRRLGAKKLYSRHDLVDESDKPLLKNRWAGAIDTVGGRTLETLLKACGRNGNIAVCGLVASYELQTTVYPFILNGVNLLGIETADTPREIRLQLWEKLSGKWHLGNLLDEIIREVALHELNPIIDDMLNGESKGRVIVRLNEDE